MNKIILLILNFIPRIFACTFYENSINGTINSNLSIYHLPDPDMIYEHNNNTYECDNINYWISNISNDLNNTIYFFKYDDPDQIIYCNNDCNFRLNCRHNFDDHFVTYAIQSNFSYEIQTTYRNCHSDLFYLIPIIIIPSVAIICIIYHCFKKKCML